MREMYLPKHMGDQVSVNGVVLKANEHRVVEIPEDHVAEMTGHGLVDISDEAAMDEIMAKEAADAGKPAKKTPFKTKR